MNRFASLRKRLMLVAGASLLTALVASPPIPASAKAETPNKEEHCLLTVTGKDANNFFTTAPLKCYGTFAEVMRATGSRTVKDSVTPQEAKAANLLGDTVIGVHYDGYSASGSTLTVFGTTCTGGGLNVPLSWNDRISSTMNGCGSIIHYEHTNYTGASQITFGNGSLTNFTGYMDNRTSSILYY